MLTAYAPLNPFPLLDALAAMGYVYAAPTVNANGYLCVDKQLALVREMR